MDIADYLNKGADLVKKNDFKGVVEVMNTALGIDPDNLTALQLRAYASFLCGDREKALVDAERMITLAPEKISCWRLRGNLYFDMGAYDKAFADYTQCVILAPEDTEVLRARGDAYYDMGEYDKAIADYTQCVILAPEATEFWHIRGDTYRKMGEYDKAVADYTRYITLAPEELTGWQLRGDAYRDMGAYDKAIADYTQCVTLWPIIVDGWQLRGELYLKMGEYDKAVADFSQCVARASKNPDSWFRRGDVYYDMGEYDKAFADFNKSLEYAKTPHHFCRALGGRGMVLMKKGKPDEALKDFQQVLAYDPQSFGALYHVGAVFVHKEKFEKALPYFTRALAIRKDIADTWAARALCYQSICNQKKLGYWHKGGNERLKLALADTEKALACDPHHAPAYLYRGTIRCCMAHDSDNLLKTISLHKMTKEVEQRIMLAKLEHSVGKDFAADVDTVIRGARAPQDEVVAAIAKMLGEMTVEYSRDSVEDLSRSIEFMPGNETDARAEAYFVRGLSYALLEEKDKARADFDQAETLNPQHPRVAEERAKLSSPS
jgi:tetratricopeptide (TPR) repeat protein